MLPRCVNVAASSSHVRFRSSGSTPKSIVARTMAPATRGASDFSDVSASLSHFSRSITTWFCFRLLTAFLMIAAKEKWLSGDVPGARAVLMEAFAANHDNENIWLAAVKLEWENNELERARMLLSKARTRADTERVWLKSALLERETGQGDDERKILDAALTRYPLFDKLWMMRAQLEERQGGDRAKEFFRKGLRAVPASVPLWIMLARHEERHVSVAKARGVLELARLKSPKTPELWLEAVRLERRHDGSGGGTALSLSAGSVAGEGEGSKLATSLMAKALQDCPAAGILWAEDIAMAPRPRQKVRKRMRARAGARAGVDGERQRSESETDVKQGEHRLARIHGSETK